MPAPAPAPAPPPAPPRRGGTLALVVMMTLANGVSSLPSAAVVLALPQIHQDLGVSVAALQWVLTGYLIANAALIVAGGRLADQFGRRRLLVAGTVLFIASSVTAALAPDLAVLVGASVGMGAGSAILTPASLAVITNAIPASARGGAVGAWGAASAVASGLGPLLGGLLTAVDWRLVFWVNVPLAVVVLAYTLLAAPESREPGADGHVDVAGLALSASSLTALTLVLVQGAVWGWASPAVIALALGTVALVAAFLLVESRSRRPLMDLRLFRLRGYSGAMLVVGVLNYAFGTATFVVPMLIEEAQGRSPAVAGLLMLPLSAAMAVTLPVGGVMASRTGVRLPMLAGLLVMAGAALLMALPAARTSDPVLLSGLFLLGAGTGLALTPLNLSALNAVAATRHGEASGVLTMLAGLGNTLGVAATGAILTALGAEEPGRITDLDQAFAVAMIIGAAVALAGAALTMVIMRGPARATGRPLPATPAGPS